MHSMLDANEALRVAHARNDAYRSEAEMSRLAARAGSSRTLAGLRTVLAGFRAALVATEPEPAPRTPRLTDYPYPV